MATVHKIREGFFLISWNNPIRTSTKQTTVYIEEISLSCQLCYTVNCGRERTTSLVMEFQHPSTKEKYPETLEPSSVMASQFGRQQQPMTLQNAKWTTIFLKDKINVRGIGLVYEILIDFSPKSMSPMKAESKRALDFLLSLWDTKTMADVTFKFKEKKIQAHSLILASASPVLAAIFQNDFRTKQERVLEIQDFEPSIIEKLLRFIYTGDVDVDNVKTTDLLILADVADKYGVNSLKEECALRLTQNLSVRIAEDLSVENAIQLLVLSHLHTPNFYEAILDFMSKNAKAICSRKEWIDVMKKYPELSFVAMQCMAKE